MLGILTKLQKTLNTNALRNLYFTFIHAYLTNGLTVWGSADKKYLDPLIKNQKKAIRIITFSPKNAHTSELFSQLRILPLPSLYNSLLAITARILPLSKNCSLRIQIKTIDKNITLKYLLHTVNL